MEKVMEVYRLSVYREVLERLRGGIESAIEKRLTERPMCYVCAIETESSIEVLCAI
jgi:hypothetical protein